MLAEGVETEVTWRQLTPGIDETEGYLFARPMPAGHIEGWIRSHQDANQHVGEPPVIIPLLQVSSHTGYREQAALMSEARAISAIGVGVGDRRAALGRRPDAAPVGRAAAAAPRPVARPGSAGSSARSSPSSSPC